MNADAPAANVVPVESTGFFGPDSVAWRVLSTPAAALTIAQITNLLEVPHQDFQAVLMGHDPLFPTNRRRQRGASTRKDGRFHDRLRRTVSVPFPILFGDKRTATECARRLFDFHRPMKGSLPGGSSYAATDPDAMLFAAVTITHAGLIAYEKYSCTDRLLPRRLPPADRDRYFREMTQLGVLMGVPRERIPDSSAAVALYYRSIADKMRTVPGFPAAQRRTALLLLRPDSWSDVGNTLADIALMASLMLGYAALPIPSRRLNGVPAVADPVLALVHASALPGFALLRIGVARRAILSRYLGDDSARILEDAATQVVSHVR